MDENWYALHLHIQDRITEARAAARTRSLIGTVSSSHRGWYVLGVGLIRLGSWVLARATEPRQHVARPLATLRAALKSS
jgi:hypothetical protein